MRKSLREAVHLTEQCLGGNCSPILSFCARVVRCESGISAIEKWTPSDLRQRRQVSHVRVIATPLTFCSRVDQDERLRECLLEVSCCRRSFFLSFFFLSFRGRVMRERSRPRLIVVHECGFAHLVRLSFFASSSVWTAVKTEANYRGCKNLGGIIVCHSDGGPL